MEVRIAKHSDLQQLLELYTQTGNSIPSFDAELENLWQRIMADENHHVVVGVVDGIIVSSCVLNVILNLTKNQCPYAIIENVVTHEDYRNRGYASQVLDFAREIAKNERCYKITLTTGSKRESTLRFYEKAGYNQDDKIAFIQWLG